MLPIQYELITKCSNVNIVSFDDLLYLIFDLELTWACIAAIEDDYVGPKLEDGKVTLKFMNEMMDWFKDQKKLHRKCAYQVKIFVHIKYSKLIKGNVAVPLIKLFCSFSDFGAS